jgi:hypothetical protein
MLDINTIAAPLGGHFVATPLTNKGIAGILIRVHVSGFFAPTENKQRGY